MTVSEFKNEIQNARSESIWIKTPSGNNYPISQESYIIAVGFDCDRHDDGEYVFVVHDSTTGDYKLDATNDVAKSAALHVFGSYPEGIVLEGEVY